MVILSDWEMDKEKKKRKKEFDSSLSGLARTKKVQRSRRHKMIKYKGKVTKSSKQRINNQKERSHSSANLQCPISVLCYSPNSNITLQRKKPS